MLVGLRERISSNSCFGWENGLLLWGSQKLLRRPYRGLTLGRPVLSDHSVEIICACFCSVGQTLHHSRQVMHYWLRSTHSTTASRILSMPRHWRYSSSSIVSAKATDIAPARDQRRRPKAAKMVPHDGKIDSRGLTSALAPRMPEFADDVV